MKNSSQSLFVYTRSIWKRLKRRILKMAKSFKNLRAKMSPESKSLSEKIASDLRQEIRLNELRNVLDISQEELGELLNRCSDKVKK